MKFVVEIVGDAVEAVRARDVAVLYNTTGDVGPIGWSIIVFVVPPRDAPVRLSTGQLLRDILFAWMQESHAHGII